MKFFKRPKRLSRSAKAEARGYDEVYSPSLVRKGKKRLILLECWGGKKINDSPLAIAKGFAALAPDWQIRFSTIAPVKSEFEQVERNSNDYWQACADASIIVDNNVVNTKLHKHPEQLILQTWHGAPIKKIGYDIERGKSAAKNDKTQLLSEVVLWDALLSPSAYVTDIFRGAFGFMGEVLEFGQPRNDVLHREAESTATMKALRDSLGIPEAAKVVLYAPTWRDEELIQPGVYGFADAMDIEALAARFPDLWFMYRGHHLQQDPYRARDVKNFVNVSNWETISDLYLSADILISDYSSVMVDYSLLRRPIIRYAPDLDRYKNGTGGFYCDFESDLPMPLCTNHAQLVAELDRATSVTFAENEKWTAWYKNYAEFEDGQAARKTTEWLLSRMER